MLPTLSHEEILRYSRHLLIPEVGLEGQRKRKASRVPAAATNPHPPPPPPPPKFPEPYDLIIDGTDNFPTRYLTNDLCVLTGKPNVYGSIYRLDGQVGRVDAPRRPGQRCLFPDP